MTNSNTPQESLRKANTLQEFKIKANMCKIASIRMPEFITFKFIFLVDVPHLNVSACGANRNASKILYS